MQTVLVLDDHPLLREVVRAMLESRGIPVRVTESADECLTEFRQDPASVVLVDLEMPGKNGIEVCRQLQRLAAEKGRTLCALLMTGATRSDLPAVAEAAGARAVLRKPFSTSELIACLESLGSNCDGQSAA